MLREAERVARAISGRLRATPADAMHIAQPDVRRQLRELLEVELPRVTVFSYPEIASDARIERREPVRFGL